MNQAQKRARELILGAKKNPAKPKKPAEAPVSKRALAKVIATFEEWREKMSKDFPKLMKVKLIADSTIHDSPRHFAMTRSDGAEVRVAPELAKEPLKVIRGVLIHELGHAAVGQGYVRIANEKNYDLVERQADKVAEGLSGLKIFYDKRGVEVAGPRVTGTRPRPKGLR